MPTRTVQTTRMASTVTKTAVTQMQSLEVVQTLLHGSLSSLAYLRSFFSEKVFDQQPYAANDRMPSYREYADGKIPSFQEGNELHTTMQVLRRGRSRRVDTFLDWLEKGAFVALKRGKLRILQVYVHASCDDREKVIETYTFNVKYHDDGCGGRALSGLVLDSPGRDRLTVEATNLALQQLLRHVMEMCNGLPELPEDRHVSMALFVENDGGNDIHVNEFVPNTMNRVVFGKADGWEKQTLELKELKSAYHSTSFSVAHLHNTALGAVASVAEPIRIPADLDYTSEAAIDESLRLPRGNNDAMQRLSTRPLSMIDDTPSTIAPMDEERDSPAKPDLDNLITPAPTSDATANLESTALCHSGSNKSPQRLAYTLDTQSSNVPNMKRALRAMVQPERLTQGDTQAQHLQKAEISSSEASGSPPQSMSTHQHRPEPKPTAMQLLPDVKQQLEGAKSVLQEMARKLARVGKSRARSDIVSCQCGICKDDGDMVQCSYCNTWQHTHCYGYSGGKDPRLPEAHACYQCLFSIEKSASLSKIRDLVLQRRAVWLILRGGLSAKQDFSTALEIDQESASSVHAYLQNEGFIVQASRLSRGHLGKSTKAQLVPLQDGAAYDKLLATLFDPLKCVEIFFYTNISSPSVAIGQQLHALRLAGMLPPATPASQAKKQISATSASGLDLPQFVVPIETPFPNQRSQPKRSQEDDIFSSTPKRQAISTPVYLRLKSVQSRCMLKANGLSSSPSVA